MVLQVSNPTTRTKLKGSAYNKGVTTKHSHRFVMGSLKRNRIYKLVEDELH